MQSAGWLGRFVAGTDQGWRIMIYNFLMWWRQRQRQRIAKMIREREFRLRWDSSPVRRANYLNFEHYRQSQD